MKTIQDASSHSDVAGICDALGVSRASYYRWLRPRHGAYRRREVPRALTGTERAEILKVLHEDRFVDKAPAQVVATLLDEDRYLCSERTMYRLLDGAAEVRERRDQLQHPAYVAPELLAERPNELWSWDITKLPGPAKWSYFHLYVILDVFSRFVVGWMVAERESATLAEKLIEETCQRQDIGQAHLTIHADRGAAMTSKQVAHLLADLGVTKTHSRPHVSNDNPFSEAHFKTLKYMPAFPQRFGCLQDARAFLTAFFAYYNNEHRHSGIAMMTPYQVHHGLAPTVQHQREKVMRKAYQVHPERFVRGPSVVRSAPPKVWINPPAASPEATPTSANS
jgi:putative transposase